MASVDTERVWSGMRCPVLTQSTRHTGRASSAAPSSRTRRRRSAAKRTRASSSTSGAHSSWSVICPCADA
eukprot:3681519-Rhodomonas_salina.2